MRLIQSCLGAWLLALVGGVVGFIGLGYVSIALLWDFPSAWEPLTGLTGTPQALLALDAHNDRMLIRTADGGLFTCLKEACTPAEADWSSTEPCDVTTQPAILALLPYVLSSEMRELWACERAYLDTVRTTLVTSTAAGAWRNTGLSLFPADAAVLGFGLLGGAVGFGAGLVLSAVAVVGLALWRRLRPGPSPANVTGENLAP